MYSTNYLTKRLLYIGLFILLFYCIGCTSGQLEPQKSLPSISSKEVPIVGLKSPSLADNLITNQYKNDLKEGLWRTYYKNENLKSEYLYTKGKKQGIGKEWWETGTLWTEGNYKDDKANGWMKWYNQEGVLVAAGNMTNNKRDGKWKICDFDLTSNCIEASFKDDKKIGLWKILHDNGRTWKEQHYDQGKMISETCWDKKGNIIVCL